MCNVNAPSNLIIAIRYLSKIDVVTKMVGIPTTIPAQFAPFFDRTLDFNSKLFLDEFAHFKVIGDKTVTKLRGFHENKELLRFFISTMNE